MSFFKGNQMGFNTHFGTHVHTLHPTLHILSSHARLPLCVICNTINRLQMAWILLNIHRVTEAMGKAAVFYWEATFS